MKTIDLGPLKLPLEIITMRIAVYGDSGAGKTTFARLLAENVHASRHRFGAIDLKNDWYGLKSSADGASAGIPVVIFGGPHGDVKLFDDPAAAQTLARVVTSIDQSFIIDLDGLSRARQEKFLAPFLDSLYEANRDPLLIFCDEADRYAPQKPMTQEAILSLSSSEDIARRGRKRGIGSFWLTQRTAVLNKNVSEFANLVVVFRTPGEKDLRELEDRVGRIAGRETVKEVMRRAPGLADGEAFFLSSHPKLRKFMPDPVAPVQLPLPWTFDSSATPAVGQKRKEPKVLAQTDLAAIETRMAATVERAKQEDPRALRAEVSRLKAELAKAQAAKPVKQEVVKTRKVEIPVLKDGQLARAEKLVHRAGGVLERLRHALDEIAAAVKKVAHPFSTMTAGSSSSFRHTSATRPSAVIFDELPSPAPLPIPPKTRRLVEQTIKTLDSHIAKSPANGDAAAASTDVGRGGLRRILTALAQRNGLTNRQIGIRAGLSSQSGTFSTYLSQARRSGWIQDDGDRRYITAQGVGALGHFEPLPGGQALLEHWLRELGNGGAHRILKALADAYPRALSNEEIGQAAQISHASGTFSTYMSKLRGLELVESAGKATRASAELFEEVPV